MIGLTGLVLVIAWVVLLIVRRERLPETGRDPLDLGIALSRMARDRHGLTPSGPPEQPGVRVVDRQRAPYDWRGDTERLPNATTPAAERIRRRA